MFVHTVAIIHMLLVDRISFYFIEGNQGKFGKKIRPVVCEFILLPLSKSFVGKGNLVKN